MKMSHEEHEERPRALYKYCGPDRMDVLRNRCIRFTQRQYLNDIYEMRPTVVFDEGAYTTARGKLANTHPEIRDIPVTTSAEHENAVDSTLQRALVLSLSSEWDIIPMWSYYADSHKGFVIGFNIADPFLAKSTRPVTYTTTFPVMDNNFEPAIYHKFEQWKHEHEWRSLRVLEHDFPDQTLCDDTHLFRFSPDAIIEVILGNRMNEDHKCQILENLKDPAYGHVEVFEAVPDSNAWALQRKRI
jgi:hypothetical protein